MSTATKTRATLPGGTAAPSKPKKAQRGRGRPRGSESKFFGRPIREAKQDLTLPLLQVDVEKAQAVKAEDVNAEENFLACVIAQAVNRVCGAERAAIMRRTAYVAFPGEGHAKRYTIVDKSRAVLEAWDRGEPVVEGVELRLKAPSKRRTRAAMRAQHERYRAMNRRGSEPKTQRKQRKPDPLHNIVRNGNLVRWS